MIQSPYYTTVSNYFLLNIFLKSPSQLKSKQIGQISVEIFLAAAVLAHRVYMVSENSLTPPVHMPVSFQIPPATSLVILWCCSLKKHCSSIRTMVHWAQQPLCRNWLLPADFYFSGTSAGFLPPTFMHAGALCGRWTS